MAELIAQGPNPNERWRRMLRTGEPVVVGREAGLWSVGWDAHVSRQHARLTWQGLRLLVERLPTGRNPIFLAGEENARFELDAGGHFVIGQTSFTLLNEHVSDEHESPRAVEEQTYSPQYLRGLRFHNADHRIDVLTRLPELISGAGNDEELLNRLVNMLLSGMPRANTVALVVCEAHGPEGHDSLGHGASCTTRVLHWDRRLGTGGEFRASHRLVAAAVGRGQSVLHVWGKSQAADPTYTMAENMDWAFCTPLRGEACAGWAVYVGGKLAAEDFRSLRSERDPQRDDPQRDEAEPGDLREDVKFTELVASTISSLRDVQLLQRRQSTLSQFFAPAVFEAMAAEKPEVVLAPRETEVTVLFCDLRGFTRHTERSADNLMGLLERVSKALGVMTHHILDQGGVFGDFQGDAAMGFWGWPLAQPDKVERACLAALAIRREFESAAKQPGHPLADFRMGIGLATGRAVAGRIGTTDQVKVTVFGPVVNRASRLEALTKVLQTPTLLDEATAKIFNSQVESDVARLRRLATVRPYGMESPVEVSELLPAAAEYPDLSDADLKTYEQALDAFNAGRWSEALELLHQVPAKDRVKDFLTIYIVEHGRTPPADFNGVIPLASKGG
ncbi:MAG TPA: adenylate/guanylate cyclase domain-containing protein [Pirellulales bacterium]|jgi:adenylate cyclase|nr:adenylate/guanylate cyclase domain-containing protein [Pirellulales bacterium]